MDANVLFSSVGRRVQLVECFRRSLQRLGVKGALCGVDCSPLAPAAYRVDRFSIVPRCGADDFVPSILSLCRECEIRLLIPTIDTELTVYASHREQFKEAGVMVAVSSPETVAIAGDKTETNRWLNSKGLPTVRQAVPRQVLKDISEWAFPVVVKPRHGSASIGVRMVTSPEELREAAHGNPDLVVEERAPGVEHTINVLVNREGRCTCAVPHARLEVRAGEVSKGRTEKNRELMDLSSRIAEALPGAFGPLNIQCFVSREGNFRITEINARFGGGFPLAYEAGADFPGWILEDSLGVPSSASFDQWQDGLTMLRYDEAVYVTSEQLKLTNHEEALRSI